MMKGYKHMMGQIRLSEEKKTEIQAALARRPDRKRRRPAVVRLAAAAALACLLCIAAGVPDLLSYRFANGGAASVGPEGLRLAGGDGSFRPVEVRDGRLWFTVDGLEIDITGLVDEETPYIYARTDPVSGASGYVVVGGSLEDLGWAEFYVEAGAHSASGMSVNAGDELLEIDGRTIPYSQLTSQQQEQVREGRKAAPAGEDPFHGTIVDRPWMAAAKEQLGIYP